MSENPTYTELVWRGQRLIIEPLRDGKHFLVTGDQGLLNLLENAKEKK